MTIRSEKMLAFLSVGLASVLSFPASAAPVREWVGGVLSWEKAGDRMRALGPRGFVTADMEASGRVTFSAEVTPGKADGDLWCTLGIGLMDDLDNYWLLNLLRRPAANGGTIGCELSEMREGVWGAGSADRLRVTVARGDGRWEAGTTYRMTLDLSPTGVVGRIERLDGTLVYARGYAFDGNRPAVKFGAPLLYSKGGFSGVCGAFDVRADATLKRPPTAYPPYVSSATVPGVTGRKTGFFHMEKAADGRWWVIDPNGNGTFLRGVCGVRYNGHACERLGGRCLYGENNRKKFATPADWERSTLDRLGKWGFNALGAGSQRSLWRRGCAHSIMIGIGQKMTKMTEEDMWIGPDTSCPRLNFPNVFHPQFQAFADGEAKAICAPHRDDPWLIGYFIDNELSWRQAAGADGLCNRVMTKKPDHSAKAALRDFLRERVGGDLAAFNRLWGTDLASFDDILRLERLPGGTPDRLAAKEAFMALAAERYFAAAEKAIRRADPNHMNLGARFSGVNDECVWAAAGRHCDLLAVNCYPWADLDRNVIFRHRGRAAERVSDLFGDYYRWSGKPLYVTEWSFPSFESGLPCTVGAGERFHTQRERAQASALYMKTLMALPQVAGYDYFIWVDQPPLGISIRFPEDSNYGLVNAKDEPYADLVKTFTDLQTNLGKWRYEPLPAERELPPAEPLTAAKVVRNALRRTAKDLTPVSFVREGDRYVVSNACGLVVRGRTGGSYPMPVLEDVSLGGKPMGSLGGALLVRNLKHGDLWQYTGRVLSAEWAEGPSGTGLLTVRCAGGEGRKGSAWETPYEAELKYVFFPDRPWILASLEKLANRGNRSYPLKLFTFRQNAPFQHDLRPGKGFRPAWREADKGCWIELDTGAFAGALSYAPDLLRINYDATVLKGDQPAHLRRGDPKRPYANPMTALAPEAEWRLAKGEKADLGGKAWILCVYGTSGGDPQWRKSTWAAEAEIGRGAAAGETSMGW